MSKSILSFILLIFAAGLAYLYIGDRLDEYTTSDAILHAQQVIIAKTPESENSLISGTQFTGGEIANDLVIEQQRTDFLKRFIEETKNNNESLLILSGGNSTLYLGEHSSGVLQVSTSKGVDMYAYSLEESDYRVPVALWGEGYDQSDFYEFMKEKGILAQSGCVLDQDGFEIFTEEYQKQVDDYRKRYEESQKTGEEFVDDGRVEPLRCGNNKVFCTAQGCGWVFNGKTGGGGHGFNVRQESLVIH